MSKGFVYHYEKAADHLDQGKFQEAALVVQRALALMPANANALNLLGVAQLKQNNTAAAQSAFQQALESEPHNAEVHNNLGSMFWSQKQFFEANHHFKQAHNTKPNSARFLFNLGNSYRALDQLEASMDAYRKCIALKPEKIKAYLNLSILQDLTGDHTGAKETLDLAIKYKPDSAEARFSRAMLLLKLGEYKKGWSDYEWRFYTGSLRYIQRLDWHHVEWAGQDLAGKTLLVEHEQGLGDALHFLRYFKLLKDKGAKIVFRCAPPLFRLLDSSPLVDRVLNRQRPQDETGPRYDYVIYLMSLPRVLGTELDSIPADIPYLYAKPELAESWSHKINGPGLKVGLAWSGKLGQKNNHWRSVPFAKLAALKDISGITYYSLQKGRASIADQNQDPGFPIIDFTKEMTDLADTAAVIENLDLVITVDTVIAHLAGAMGKPVWNLLWSNCCWRYLLERNDSPWYPTMRLIRQQQRGHWDSVMSEVRDSLRLIVSENSMVEA